MFLISIGEPSCIAQSAKSFKLSYNKTSSLTQASKLRSRQEVSGLGSHSTFPSLAMCLSSTNHAPAELQSESGWYVPLEMLEIAVLGPS